MRHLERKTSIFDTVKVRRKALQKWPLSGVTIV